MRGATYALVHVCLLLCAPLYLYPNTPLILSSNDKTPVAVEDHYTLMVNCNNDFLSGNLLDNDVVDSTIFAQVAYVVASDTGMFSCDPNGSFAYFPEENFSGTVTISYCLQNTYSKEYHTEAKVYISVQPDSDCDNIIDAEDIDNDNDGILNIHEGSEDLLDSDGDGILDCFDIDSDNDGITDLIEWQNEGACNQPMLVDENLDGWDDAFDASCGGDYYEAVDTDMDGLPDFIDDDSDDDGISDHIEACDLNNDSIADIGLMFRDTDHDGLDDAFDTINCCSYQAYSVLSNVPLPDSNKNNVRNWRDVDNRVAPSEEAEAKTFENLLVYPNPVKSRSIVSFLEPVHSSANWYCKVFNQFGSLVLQFKIHDVPFDLNMDNLPAGTYLIQVFDRYYSFSTSLIKTD